MKKFFSYIVVCFPLILFSQSNVGIFCNNFEINNEKREEDDNLKALREAFKRTLQKLQYPPIIVEREKLSDLLVFIEEEKNLRKDFNNNNLQEKFEAAQVDYIAYGNFYKAFNSDEYDFQLEFIKVSGSDVLSVIPLPITRFKEKELIGTRPFEEKVNEVLKTIVFTKEFGITQKSALDEFNKRLDEKDKQYNELKRELDGLKPMVEVNNWMVKNEIKSDSSFYNKVSLSLVSRTSVNVLQIVLKRKDVKSSRIEFLSGGNLQHGKGTTSEGFFFYQLTILTLLN